MPNSVSHEQSKNFKPGLLISKPVLCVPWYPDLMSMNQHHKGSSGLGVPWRECLKATYTQEVLKDQGLMGRQHPSLPQGQREGSSGPEGGCAHTCLRISSLMLSWVSGSVGIVAMLDHRRGFVTCFSVTFPKSSCTCVKNTYRTRLLI